ncbi:MAG: cyclic nucleotide-binding domain-containing protein [Rhodospirillales bacterium]
MERTNSVGNGANGAPHSVALSVFRQVPVFRDVDDRTLSGLAAISTMVSAPEDSILCRQGHAAERLLVLLEGQVALENTTPSGASAVVDVVRPGGHFMLSAVLSGLPGLMSARTVTAAKLIGIEAEGLRTLLHNEVSLAGALLRAEAMEFGNMVRQVCDLKLRTTAQRLGCYLLALTDQTAANSMALRLPFDKRLLAARLGCRQENLSRAFAALRRLGVETHGARVILHDIASLRDYSAPDGDTEFEAI